MAGVRILVDVRWGPTREAIHRLATFGDTQLLDFLPLRVNAMSQQHERIAERVLAWTLRAVEHNDYQPGIEAIGRSFNART